MADVSTEPFAQHHLTGLATLFAAESWAEYTDDLDRTQRALTAPGVTTLVAIVGRSGGGALHGEQPRLGRPAAGAH